MVSDLSFVCKGATIRYRRFGEGPALLFFRSEDSLPDAPAFIDSLAQDFEVIVPDHPGFRNSDTPDWLKGIGDIAYSYLDFLDELALDRVHLVGASLGGWAAAEIAIRTCERIATLHLIAPLGVRRKGTPFGDIFLWTPEENLHHRFFDQRLAEQFVASMQAQSKEAATAYLKDRYAAARLCWHPRFYNPELERWLSRIDRPLQLIWGDSDEIIPASIAETWCQALPQARLSMISQCGHLPQIEQPKVVAERIRSFIKEVAT
jgi:pimeloyl-ACP methyl ester carboxylesterase